MRVLHLIKTGIGATWAFRQIRELKKLGIDVHVVMPPGPMVEAYRNNNIQLHLLNTEPSFAKLNSVITGMNQIRDVVITIRPKLIHSHFLITTMMMRLALLDSRIPRVFQVPGPLHLENRVTRLAEINSASSLDFWIATCDWTRCRYVASGVPRNRIYLAYYGTDVESFGGSKIEGLKQSIGISNNTAIIGMVAYMYPPKWYIGQFRGLKGHEDLLDAISLCIGRGLDLVGVFVGGAWGNGQQYERKVRAYANKRCGDKAIFLGTRKDVAQLYSIFDVAVHPSLSENLGGSVESLLSEVPTIATEIGGFPDLIVPHETGWLVPPRAPTLLADTIERILSDRAEANRIAKQGAIRASRMFDVKNTAEDMHRIYCSIIKRSTEI